MNGFLVVDKPGGMTSRDVVNRFQSLLPRKTKLGHAGTLDPLATGVLILCIGAATRLTDRVQEMGKTYHSRFRLGARSTTDDADGEITETGQPIPSREAIEAALTGFQGTIAQVPPAYSAISIGGRRAYDLAREGNAPDLSARPVRVDAIRVLAYEPPFLNVEIDCGKGTYIRSIARDLGEVLGCGALVQTLRRTRTGSFRVENAVDLEIPRDAIPGRLHPLTEALPKLERVLFSDDLCQRFRNGQAVPVATGSTTGEVAAIDSRGELVGIGTVEAGGRVRPHLVIPSAKPPK